MPDNSQCLQLCFFRANKEGGKLHLQQLLMPWFLDCSKWPGAYCHRSQVHILTIFHNSRINNIHALWAAIWSLLDTRQFCFKWQSGKTIPMRVFRISYVFHTPAINWKGKKIFYRFKLSKWMSSCPVVHKRDITVPWTIFSIHYL